MNSSLPADHPALTDPVPPENAPGEESIGQIWRTLVRYRFLLAACVLGMTALAAMVAWTAPKFYRAEVLLAPAEDRMGGAGLAQLAGQFAGLASLVGLESGSMDGEKNIALATLRSDQFLESFIADNDLMPLLLRSRWDREARRWKPSSWRPPPTIGDAVRVFTERVLTVSEDRRTGLVRVSVEWRDRELAAKWANELVRRINRRMQQRAIEDSSRRQDFLRKALPGSTFVEVSNAINRLLETEIKREMVAKTRPDYAFAIVDPAMIPDAHQFVRPRRVVWLVFGLVAGLFTGVLLALVHNAVRASRPFSRAMKA